MADEPQILASIEAAAVVLGNGTYRPEALDILGLPPAACYAFVRCTRCGFVYAHEQPDATFLARLYGEVIDAAAAVLISKSPAWIAHQLQLAALLLSRLTSDGIVRVLDYGCGDGTVVRALTASGISCLGFDPYQRTAADDLTDSRDDLKAGAPFHAALLSDVLEHVPDPGKVLEECHDLLAPGGWLCVSVPDFSSGRLRSVLRDLSAGRPVTPELNPWEHLNYFSPESLTAMLERSHFRVDPDPAPNFGLRKECRALRKITNTVRSSARLIKFATSPAPGSTTIFAQRRPM